MKAGSISEQVLTGQVLEKELQKSNDLIDQFIYSCSHGLRSPIKSMAGLVTLLKGCGTDDKSNQELYARLLSNSIAKAESIRSQFEAFAGISTKSIPFELINLNSFLKKILRGFKTQLQETGISVSLHLDQKGDFYSQPVALNMILHQLISNAILFNDSNKVTKTISLFVTASLYSCSIQVHDNGLGIAEGIRDKIFNLFYRGSEKSQGAGIGLYIAREITTKMGGTLSLQSSNANGSVFSLWIPNGIK